MILFLLLINPIFGQSNEPVDELPVSVLVYVDWNIDEGTAINKGTLRYSIKGTLKLDRAHTKEIKTPGIPSGFPFPVYKVQSMFVDYNYLEEIYEKEEGNCPDLLVARYQKGAGSFSLSDDPTTEARADFFIRKLSSMLPKNQQMGSLKNMPGAPKGAAFCDYYEFYAAGSWQTISGERRGSDCEYKSAEKDIIICKLGLRFQIPKSGKMFGKRAWSTLSKETGGLRFKIALSDLPAPMSQSDYEPENMPGGDVKYCVVWGFGKAEQVEFEKYVKEKDKERDCEELQRRINFIKIVRKLYQNPALKEYAKNHYKDVGDAKNAYQNAIQKLSIKISENKDLETFAEIEEYIDNLSPEEIEDAFRPGEPGGYGKTFMMTTPHLDNNGEIYSISIQGFWNLEVVDMITYNSQGMNEQITDYCYKVSTEWVNNYSNYGKEVGQALFWSAIAHEKVHVRQYAANRLTKSVDELSERELEAFKTEIDKINEFRDEMDCE